MLPLIIVVEKIGEEREVLDNWNGLTGNEGKDVLCILLCKEGETGEFRDRRMIRNGINS